MRERPYYSVRLGHRSGRLEFDDLKRLFVSAYQDLKAKGYFQQVLGIDCVDADIPGSAGTDLEAFFFRKLRKQTVWPFASYEGHWDEDDLFDVIEVLHDCVSKGLEGRWHSFNGCGTHYETFDQEEGQNDFRVAINELLHDYDKGYLLTPKGEIQTIGPRGLRDLEAAAKPPGDLTNVQGRVDAAIDKFRRRGSTLGDRRDAIRDLADVMEFLRPQAKAVLTKEDEADLFNLANNFGIRHHNQRQKTQYDEAIWQSWMFYFFLSSIHATTRLIEKAVPVVPKKRQR
jgi:hypothetical protein